ncbi:guanylate cyclase D-like [Lineus longissimus]|uniref:guanylate cyclase D-like n=1 Tax=Lineus longissimus TaxID=88925 RepID=UPI002B4CE8C1
MAFGIRLQEKTKALDQERKRTVFLLHQMLPVSVAKRLLNAGSVPPENYESVTIYFSDIVGFTMMSSRSSPMQVVAMLNQIYEEFDDKVESYDVYKVETIGDAYMVASGLPERNGNCHCSEIAKLALDLQNSVAGIKIAHLPDTQLQLRIGINSGPCVAGVVGHKMPRYCLFGDTVNTASRMESHGLPGWIHISQPTNCLLSATGGFKMSMRGEIEVKGKGVMTTYWLEGLILPEHNNMQSSS